MKKRRLRSYLMSLIRSQLLNSNKRKLDIDIGMSLIQLTKVNMKCTFLKFKSFYWTSRSYLILFMAEFDDLHHKKWWNDSVLGFLCFKRPVAKLAPVSRPSVGTVPYQIHGGEGWLESNGPCLQTSRLFNSPAAKTHREKRSSTLTSLLLDIQHTIQYVLNAVCSSFRGAC